MVELILISGAVCHVVSFLLTSSFFLGILYPLLLHHILEFDLATAALGIFGLLDFLRVSVGNGAFAVTCLLITLGYAFTHYQGIVIGLGCFLCVGLSGILNLDELFL